jgi:hypothetical protein
MESSGGGEAGQGRQDGDIVVGGRSEREQTKKRGKRIFTAEARRIRGTAS